MLCNQLGLHRKPLSYLILKIMKKIFFSIAIITLCTTFNSCTADEMEPEKTQTTVTAGDTDIVPPPTPPTNPK